MEEEEEEGSQKDPKVMTEGTVGHRRWEGRLREASRGMGSRHPHQGAGPFSRERLGSLTCETELRVPPAVRMV